MQWWVLFSEVIRNLGIVAGGVLGLYLAWLRVSAANRQADAQLRQAELGRREHVTELFNRAAGQLADPKLEVRLAAIYTLRESTRAFPDLTGAVFELLTAYVRQNPQDWGEGEPPVEIREIFRILQTNLESKE